MLACLLLFVYLSLNLRERRIGRNICAWDFSTSFDRNIFPLYFKIEWRTIVIHNVVYYDLVYTVNYDTLGWLFTRHVSTSTMSSSGISIFMIQTKHEMYASI